MAHISAVRPSCPAMCRIIIMGISILLTAKAAAIPRPRWFSKENWEPQHKIYSNIRFADRQQKFLPPVLFWTSLDLYGFPFKKTWQPGGINTFLPCRGLRWQDQNCSNINKTLAKFATFNIFLLMENIAIVWYSTNWTRGIKRVYSGMFPMNGSKKIKLPTT